MAPRWLCLCKCTGPYVGLITSGVLPTVNEFVMHWMLHPHPISLVSWSSCSQSLEHDPASVTNLNDAICNICYPGNEAVHVHYVTLYKHHVVWCGVVWCGVVWCASTPLFVRRFCQGMKDQCLAWPSVLSMPH